MPVEFLSDEQAARYGRYHADPSPAQLARFFYLSPQDMRFLHEAEAFGCPLPRAAFARNYLEAAFLVLVPDVPTV